MSQFKPNANANAVLEKLPRPKPWHANGEKPAAKPPVEVAETPIRGEGSGQTGNSIALYLCVCFIFFRFSFLHEIIADKLKFDAHLLLVVGASAVIAAILTGGILNGAFNRIFLAWVGFTACMAMATLASSWRGGSFAVFYPFIRTTMILVIMIPAVVNSPRSLSLIVKTIGMAGIATVLLGLTNDDYRSGRLELSGAGASIQNSNDYAALLTLVMPAVAYLSMRRGTSIVFKVIGVITLSLACFLILSTGSRGALISMAISMLYVLKVASGKVRIAILAGVPLVALIAIPFIPTEASQRLATLFGAREETSEAAASKIQRTALLMESIRFTAQHPLLGVGPGTFEEYQANAAEQSGLRGMWHETHNSYTQISSECGIPALLFYATAIFLSFRVFQRGRKSSDPELRSIASILGLMVVSFSVCMFFLSQGYGSGFPVLGGLAISLERLLAKEAAPDSSAPA
jgi:hypothetical protein